MSLRGALALVTGGSGTIGLAISKALASHGASVILTGRRVEALDLAVQKIKDTVELEKTQSVWSIPCDVTQEESVQALFQKVEDSGKSIDLLVNNAGINVPGASVDLSAHDFDWVMKVNVLGPFICSREAIKRMKDGGRIINIGSLSAMSPRPDSAPYTTSKFALQGLTQSLALDAREHNIAVGIIHPGNVKSLLLTEEMIAARKHEGFLQPEEVAKCVVTMAELPYSANVLEMTLMPTPQPFVGRG